ncbi:MAG TPA: hypothetical protein VGG84_09355 [Gemmatimonadaceae bacterium]
MTRRDWVAATTIALLALAATVTSLGHDFTFDDRYVILTNSRVHELKNFWHLFAETYWPRQLGGDGYRPLVIALFTMEWLAAGGAPWVFHLVNILLTVGASLAVYWCAAAILPRRGAWVAAALFAVHPVHVEVTGNVVGQSELIVAVCLAAAVGVYLRARRHGPLGARAAGAVLSLYVIALLSKEHAVVFPALLAVAEATVLRGNTDRWRVRDVRPLALAIVAITLGWFYIRTLVFGGVAGFYPFPVFQFLHLGMADRAGMMMTEIPRIARLLVFPTRLSGDYSPTEVLVTKGFDVVEIPGIVICFGVLLLAVALRRRAPVVSFGLFWVIVSYLPVSNILVPTGFITAERTLFVPSIGVVLVAGALATMVEVRSRRAEQIGGLVALALLLSLGLARSIDRQRVWKNNDVFFAQLLKDAPNGYRAHFLYGRLVAERLRLHEMEIEYRRAIKLFPYDISMTLAVASDYYRAGFCEPAVALLDWSFAVEPLAIDGRYEYVQCLLKLHRWPQARAAGLEALRHVRSPLIAPLRGMIASADSALGRRTAYRQPNAQASRKVLALRQNTSALQPADDPTNPIKR